MHSLLGLEARLYGTINRSMNELMGRGMCICSGRWHRHQLGKGERESMGSRSSNALPNFWLLLVLQMMETAPNLAPLASLSLSPSLHHFIFLWISECIWKIKHRLIAFQTQHATQIYRTQLQETNILRPLWFSSLWSFPPRNAVFR